MFEVILKYIIKKHYENLYKKEHLKTISKSIFWKCVII
jgi:hypothetical protein